MKELSATTRPTTATTNKTATQKRTVHQSDPSSLSQTDHPHPLLHNGGESVLGGVGGLGNRKIKLEKPLMKTSEDWPATTTTSEVSVDQCSDLVRYDPKKARKVSKIYSEWNMRQEIILRPPIVFNGTFPIDIPISSRFPGICGRPETIDEEETEGLEGSEEEEEGNDFGSSTSSSSSNNFSTNNRLRGSNRRVFRNSHRTLHNRRPGFDGNSKVRFRRRTQSSRPIAVDD